MDVSNWKFKLIFENGGFEMETATGIEHPPMGTVKLDGKVILMGRLEKVTAY